MCRCLFLFLFRCLFLRLFRCLFRRIRFQGRIRSRLQKTCSSLLNTCNCNTTTTIITITITTATMRMTKMTMVVHTMVVHTIRRTQSITMIDFFGSFDSCTKNVCMN